VSKRSAKSKRRGRRGRRRGRGSRVGTVLAFAACLLALSLVGVLALYVTITHRFDGRLWQLPTRVYSDTLVLSVGQPVSLAELIERLERCGYARTTQALRAPGHFRPGTASLELYARAFRSAGSEVPARRLRLEFDEGKLTSIIGGDGGGLERATLEAELLATLFGPRQEERVPVGLEQIPESFVQAVLAAEDSRFYAHHGLDLRGIVRAGWANVSQGRVVQGGSTITQQTVKNLFLGQERTWWRKLREGLMSAMLDARYDKNRILEVYLNEVYLGQRGAVAICGVQAAARFYFGSDLADLSLAESAVIAGLIRSPGRYNPFAHPERAIERRDQVLQAMLRLRMIDEGQGETARSEGLDLASGQGGYSGAGYAVDFVRSQLAHRTSRELSDADGLEIYTTLDTRWQRRAERALQTGLQRLECDSSGVRKQIERRRLQGVVVVTDPVSGAVLGMVGGRDHAQSQFNRAVQARRQPGSCFKPLIYAVGFELAIQGRREGLTPRSVLEDSPLEMQAGGQSWRPLNYDREFRGRVTVRRTLEESLNVPTVRAAQQVGLQRIIEGAHRAGIESRLAAVPSLALGAAEVTPIELATAYGTLANGGVRRSPWIVREIVDRRGRSLPLLATRVERALSPDAAFMVTDVLRGVLVRGTARSAAGMGYHGTAAGKTGTTDDTRDSWFVGYTSDLLVLTWIGYDDNARTGLTGASGALPIWVEVMGGHDGSSGGGGFDRPGGMMRLTVCADSGALAVKKCPHPVREDFARGLEPSQPCRLHQGKFKRWFGKLLGRNEET
jgi:penicillin-binding protein 1B